MNKVSTYTKNIWVSLVKSNLNRNEQFYDED